MSSTEFMSRVMSNLDGEKDAEIERLRAALKKIEDLALRSEGPAYKWGAAFAIATHTLHLSAG